VHEGAALLRGCTSRPGVGAFKKGRDSERPVCRRTASAGVDGMVMELLWGSGGMGKIVLFLGVVIGAAIFAIALVGAPSSGSVASEMPKSVAAASCHVEEFALDEGYGVSRKLTRTICGGAD
jgi:hypothetical protein